MLRTGTQDESCLPLFFHTVHRDSLVSHEINVRVVTIQKIDIMDDIRVYHM